MAATPVRISLRASLRACLPAGLCFLLLLLAGCAGLPKDTPATPDEVSWAGSGAGLLPAGAGGDIEDPAALMHVSDEMRRFARNAVRYRAGLAAKTEALMDALHSEQGLNLQYDAEATLTAEQAFRQRRANCLTYTILFVALAREVDVPAKFNNVEIPPVWDLGDDDTALLYRHINARVDLDASNWQIIDISGDEYRPHIYFENIISDTEAAAQFYNNRAVQFRLQRDFADALRYQVRALQLAPGVAYLWTNLADLYLVMGKPRAAHAAVIHALGLDSSDPLAYQTAALTYKKLGEAGLSREYRERAQRFMEQNPYYHYHLAVVALGQGDNQTAYEEIREAVRSRVRDPRFFFVLAVVFERLGDQKRAEISLAAVMELTDSAAQQERYRNKFVRLKEQRG